VRPTVEERGHRLAVAMPAEPIALEGDPTRLEQVLGNLLHNAAKYTEPGGRITLSAARVGEEAVILVRDTGVGIAPEMLPKVFEMFVQVGQPGHAQGGLGIGLGLVRSLVEMHGGRITARSDGPSRGSEFVVHLPALPPRSATEVVPATAPRPASRDARPPRRRILVVDDNLDAANSLARLLTRVYGQEVRMAHDGPSALVAAGEFLPEVVLLDIGLPGMDGYEVAHALRNLPESGGMLVVALTGWGQEKDRQRSREAGFDDHLVKPVDPEHLRAVLVELPVRPH